MFPSPLFSAETQNIRENALFLTPGTTIFINSDGRTEQGEPEALYRERLPEVFYNHADWPPQLIVKGVVDNFQEFNNGSLQGRDDITFLVIQVDL